MHIDHVLLAMPPGGEGEALRFYSEVLGMAEIAKPADLAARGGCWFESGQVIVHLGVEPDFQPPGKAHPGIQVVELGAIEAALTAAGHPVTEDTGLDDRRRIHTRDPFGNRLEFLELLPERWELDASGDRVVAVRTATIDDVGAIVALLRDDEIGRSRETAGEEDYRQAFADVALDPQQLLVVVTVDDEIVGTCQLTFTPGLSRRGMLRATIEAVRIGSQWRGNGYGELLIRWAIECARTRGAGLLQLTSDATRSDAARFYRRLGFVPSHTGFKLSL